MSKANYKNKHEYTQLENEKMSKVKKELFEKDAIIDSIEDTPNKNIVKLNRKLFVSQQDAIRRTTPIKNYYSNIIPKFSLSNYYPDSNVDAIENEDAGPQISEESDKRSRKRKRQPENWKRNIKKIKREKGEEYIDAKGKIVAAKVIKPACKESCKLMCSAIIPLDLRKIIKSDFYTLTDVQKAKFYGKYTFRETKCRNNEKHSRRSYTFNYYFPKEEEIIKVCQHFFCSTLSISPRRIYYFHLKVEKKTAHIPPTPAKGKYIKKETPPEKINEVVEHIKSFPTVESHNCRSSSTRQYLSPGLSVSKMYQLYLQNSKENPVKENIYRKIFGEKFNLGFHRPKKDVCDIC